MTVRKVKTSAAAVPRPHGAFGRGIVSTYRKMWTWHPGTHAAAVRVLCWFIKEFIRHWSKMEISMREF
jgi:hypothetical protein